MSLASKEKEETAIEYLEPLRFQASFSHWQELHSIVWTSEPYLLARIDFIKEDRSNIL